MIRHVDVLEGWGEIHFITLFAGIAHHDAIHAIVGKYWRGGATLLGSAG